MGDGVYSQDDIEQPMSHRVTMSHQRWTSADAADVRLGFDGALMGTRDGGDGRP